MNCKKCGKKLRRNEVFCTECGYYNEFTEEEKELEKEEPKEELEEDNLVDEVIKEEEPEEEEFDDIIKEEDKKNDSEDDKYISAYIGDDYKFISKFFFNFWAFLLNWLYFLYKKLYITGAIGLVITYIVIVLFRDYAIIYAGITIVLLGLLFNPYYKFIVKRRINKIKDDYDGSDSSSIEDVCREKGGSNYIWPLVGYTLFLLIVILSVVKIDIGNKTPNTKYWKENSENKANCNANLKQVYEKVYENYKDYKVIEAVCKVVKNTTKDYHLYLKTDKANQIGYFYYKVENGYITYIGHTDDLIELNNKDNLTEDEAKKKKELDLVKSNYNNAYMEAQQEDKLINKNKNTDEKLNYVFSREEVVR